MFLSPLALTLIIVGGAMLALATDRVRADVVSLLAVLALGASGVLTPQEALSGFSRSAVITILAVFMLASALQRAGVTERAAEAITRVAGNREPRLVLVVMLAAASLSLLMNNIAAAAVLLPAVSGAAQRSNVSPARLLMPLAFGTLLGGMATLLTTANIIASGMVRDAGLEPFGLLSFAPIGVPVVLCGIGYMVLVGRKRLPSQSASERLQATRAAGGAPEADLVALYGLGERLFRARVPPGSVLISRPLAETDLRQRYGVTVVAVERDGRLLRSPAPSFELQLGDVVSFQGDVEEFRRRDIEPYLEILPPRSWGEADLESPDLVLAEVVLAPRSSLVGKSLREAHFRAKYDVNVLAIWRGDRSLLDELGDLPLQFGDALLVQGRRDRLAVLRDEPELIVLGTDEPAPRPVAPAKRPLALLILLITLAVVAMAPTATGEVMLAGALGMVLFGVITMEQAYRSVEWSTVFMVAGVLPMGLALQKSGAADLIAHTLVGTAGRAGEAVLLAALVGVTVLFVQAMHGQGVTAVMVPIAITAAQQIGVDPRGFAMAVALGASIAFMTPLGHPVNLLVMSSGGYRFRDYWRVGWPLTVMLVVLVVALVPVVFPFHR